MYVCGFECCEPNPFVMYISLSLCGRRLPSHSYPDPQPSRLRVLSGATIVPPLPDSFAVGLRSRLLFILLSIRFDSCHWKVIHYFPLLLLSPFNLGKQRGCPCLYFLVIYDAFQLTGSAALVAYSVVDL